MRAASYTVTSDGSEAEVAVIPMGGMAGMELQLVNMWREQLKLTAISEAEMGSQSKEVTIDILRKRGYSLASYEDVKSGQPPKSSR